MASGTRVKPSAIDATPDEVVSKWSEFAARVRQGESVSVSADGVAIVPLSAQAGALREWGREMLGRVLEAQRGMNPDLEDEDALAAFVEEVEEEARANRSPR